MPDAGPRLGEQWGRGAEGSAPWRGRQPEISRAARGRRRAARAAGREQLDRGTRRLPLSET